jgi:flavin reductase (DIM6/NTAB) family NADH-FMN oxidoreductase RutF
LTTESLSNSPFVPSPLDKLPAFTHIADYLEYTIVDIVEHGDHAVVVAEVLEAELSQANGLLLLSTTGWSYGGWIGLFNFEFFIF